MEIVGAHPRHIMIEVSPISNQSSLHVGLHLYRRYPQMDKLVLHTVNPGDVGPEMKQNFSSVLSKPNTSLVVGVSMLAAMCEHKPDVVVMGMGEGEKRLPATLTLSNTNLLVVKRMHNNNNKIFLLGVDGGPKSSACIHRLVRLLDPNDEVIAVILSKTEGQKDKKVLETMEAMMTDARVKKHRTIFIARDTAVTIGQQLLTTAHHMEADVIVVASEKKELGSTSTHLLLNAPQHVLVLKVLPGCAMMITLPVEVLSIIMTWLPVTDVVRRGGSRASLGPLLTSSSRLYRMAHALHEPNMHFLKSRPCTVVSRIASAFWMSVCTARCPTMRCHAYTIDTFVSQFMINSYRLLASGRVVVLPEDAKSITRVIKALQEPCHVTLNHIAEGCFPDNFLSGCTALFSFDAPGLTSIKAIGHHVLFRCTSLTAFNPSGLTAVESIGPYFLSGCTALTSFDTSALTAVKGIGNAFLDGCTSLTSVNASGLTAVRAIGLLFLYGCSRLTSFDTSRMTAVTSIGPAFLSGCTSLTSFETKGLTAVKAIGDNFLYGCTSLTVLDTSGLTAVRTIGSAFLYQCTSLLIKPTEDAIYRQGKK